MDRDVERRLNRIEGMLTKLLVQCSVSEKIADRALEVAQAAAIEIKAFKESTHEVKYVRGDEYDATFGGAPAPETQEEDYGPPLKRAEVLPDSLRHDSIFDTDYTDEEMNAAYEGKSQPKKEVIAPEDTN